LKYAGGIVLELEIVNNFTDPIIDPATALDSYADANCSTAWSNTNVQCKADVVELDSAVNETFAQNLLRDNGSRHSIQQLYFTSAKFTNLG
jgi:hypothetical protein